VFFVIKKILMTRNALLLGVTLYCLIQGTLNPLLFNPGLAMFLLTIAVLNSGFKDQLVDYASREELPDSTDWADSRKAFG
jgi:hypothetical protein